MNGTELMALGVDEATLAELSGMVDENEAAASLPQYAKLKINYDADSKHPVGAWVVGQKKDADGNITEEGDIAEAVIVIMTRNRRSYYDRDDNKKSVSSVMWGRLDNPDLSAYYNKLPDGVKDKFQVVVFGLAITKDNKMVDCLATIGGSGYMPWSTHFKALTSVKGIDNPLPPFSRVTILEPTIKRKERGVTFYEPVFKLGQWTKKEWWPAFIEKQTMAKEYVKGVNEKIERDGTGGKVMRSVNPPASSKDFGAAVGGVIDTTATVSASSPGAPEFDDIPFDKPPVEAAAKPASTLDVPATPEAMGEDLDIEAAVAAALGRK